MVQTANQPSVSRRWVWFWLALTLIAFAGLALFAASGGLRGSDQYWYVADVETLLHGGPKTTNGLYPVFIPLQRPDHPPFLHDCLNLYLVLPFALLFGSYYGWVIANILGMAIGALLVYRLSAYFCGNLTALWITMCMLLFPLSVWQTSQPLAEATIVPLLVAVAWFYVRAREQLRDYFFATVFLGLVFLCRASYILPLLALPVLYLIHQPRVSRRAIGGAGVLWLLAGFFLIVQSVAFESSMLSISDNIKAKSSFGDVMLAYYRLVPPELHLSGLFRFGLLDVWRQIWPATVKELPFYFVFNALTIPFVVALFQKKSESERRLAVFTGLILVVHLSMIFLMQNQARYMLPSLPFLMVAAAWRLKWLENTTLLRYKTIGTVGLLLLAVLVNIPLVIQARSMGANETNGRNRAATVAAVIPLNDSVLLESESGFLALGYLLRPRRVMFVSAVLKELPQYRQLQDAVGAKWLICHKKSALRKLYAPLTLVSETFPPPFADYALFRLE